MYDVISLNASGHYTVISENIQTIKEAGESRVVNGDLVVYHGTNRVVPYRGWLQDCWLKTDSETYAIRKIKEVKNDSDR